METLGERLSDEMRVVLERAQQEAAARHNPYVDIEHLLLGLFYHPEGSVRELLRKYGMASSDMYDAAADTVGVVHLKPIELKGYSQDAKAALDRAAREAQLMGHHVPGAGHLLAALMERDDAPPALAKLPFSAETLRATVRAAEPPRVSPPKAFVPTDAKTPASQASGKTEFVLIPTRKGKPVVPRRTGTTTGTRVSRPSWLDRVGYMPWIVLGLALFTAYMIFVLPGNKAFTFVFVLVGWIFSVTLHEFSHAAVAYIGGDHTVKDKGYLSFNPLKYTHPMLSIGLPLLFLAMGGIGLPGGAVYIERHRLRNKWWGAAVSAAGPAANLVLAFVLAIPFIIGKVDANVILRNYYFGLPNHGGLWQDTTLWAAIAFLAMLQITAVLFNLLPIPPLDGFGILEPFLDPRTRAQLAQFGMMGLFIIFIALWYIQPLNKAFWDMIYQATGSLNIPDWMIAIGHNLFMFWQH